MAPFAIRRGRTAGAQLYRPHHLLRSPIQRPDPDCRVGTQQPWELFCHRHQTDQLILLRGSLDLVVLHNGRFERITLREDDPVMVRIPPGVPHGAINQGRYSATLVNAVLRHGPAAAGDYRPRPIPAGLLGQWQKLLNVPDSTAHLGLEQSGETPGRSVPGNG